MTGVTITNEEIFAELRSVSDKVNQVGGKLDGLVRETTDHESRIRSLEKINVADHESRIRALERKVWTAAGAAAVAGGGLVQALHAIVGG
ncbi:hypothetical protein [Amycolatopsis sp. H20-H5]|uniref:hypothetical protein n=1 Tax=Amycolatopsis sp. H20-H5 TaxID=3046309 RepID=UPI002DBDBDEF|nr:hypothetical protein [Amycolatopsis sp. H20-H5]MEC3977913.1 hypothetical protein [Amycolatopsis sp. H20-H5]